MTAKYYETIPYPSLRGVETVLGFIEKDIPKAKTADPKSFVDDSLLQEIEASGFVKTSVCEIAGANEKLLRLNPLDSFPMARIRIV